MYQFHQEMIALKKLVYSMGNHAIKMLEEGISALVNKNLLLAEKVHNDRIKLREFDEKIEEEALRLIALYQPMAIDIRTLTVCLKLNTYLFRIGRYGKDIAQVTSNFTELEDRTKLVKLDQMSSIVLQMIQKAVNAFLTNNIDIIFEIKQQDTIIDNIHQEAVHESLSYMIKNPTLISIGANYIMIVRYLERCGDHAVKIAEKVYYMITGKHIELE